MDHRLRRAVWRVIPAVLALPCCAVLAGCVPASLHPLYDRANASADCVHDPALEGVWVAGTGEEWRIGAGPDSLSYDIAYIDTHGESAHFTGMLTTIGGARLLDIELRSSGGGDAQAGDFVPGNDLAYFMQAPVHTWLAVDASGAAGLDGVRSPSSATLTVRSPRQDWLAEVLRNAENPARVDFQLQHPEYQPDGWVPIAGAAQDAALALPHAWIDTDRPLITADTAQLRQFLAAALLDPAFLGAAQEFRLAARPPAPQGFGGQESYTPGTQSNSGYDTNYRQPAQP